MVGQPRYLVADDDGEMSAWFETVLSEHGTVAVANDGSDLLFRLADDGPFDLVVTDYRMPQLTGLQVLAIARTAGLLTPFLLVTACRDQVLFDAVRRLAHVVVAKKPLSPARFLELVAAAQGLAAPARRDA